jgi:hypothetical protein
MSRKVNKKAWFCPLFIIYIDSGVKICAFILEIAQIEPGIVRLNSKWVPPICHGSIQHVCPLREKFAALLTGFPNLAGVSLVTSGRTNTPPVLRLQRESQYENYPPWWSIAVGLELPLKK